MSTYTEVKLRITHSYSLHILCNECYVACQKSGHAVAQGSRHCATSRKVAGSIPGGFIGLFIDIILPATPCPCGRLSP